MIFQANTEKKIVIDTDGSEGSLGKCLMGMRAAIVEDLIKVKHLGKVT